ncbi:MAG: hypothetical protein OEV28_13990, partial [Nitrospirota bacterium]|nr:hypothetical protein [Nitrospirota bacterium]
PESDLSVDFNPYNLGMHPVNRRGRNQPAPHLSTNWPFFNGGTGNQAGSTWWVTGAVPGSNGTVNYDAATKVVTIATGNNFPTYYMQPGWKIQFTQKRPTAPTAGNTATYWYEIKTVDSATQITLVSGPAANQAGVMFNITAGLGWTFVPPYGPWSTLACGDCHQSGDAADPAGPHGSDNPWILREINFNAAIDHDLNGSIADPVDYINTSTGIPGDATGWTATNTICYSCHRRDVYGWTAKNNGSNSNEANTPGGTASRATYSRFNSHVPGGEEDPKFNAFNIWCMSCHGGETDNGSGTGIGAIHGSNRGIGSRGGATQLGMRLRNGAGVGGHSVTAGGGSCWTKSPTNDSVSSCGVNHAPAGYASTYNYITVD